MVLPSLVPGGQEMLVVRLSLALREAGFSVGATCTEQEGPLADRMRTDGFDVALAPAPGLRSNMRADALVRRFAARRPDVMHVHSGVWLKAARAARMAGVPRVVHTIHGLLDPEPWYSAMFKRFAARHTDMIVAVSEPLRHHLLDDVAVDAAKVQVILNGVDTTHFHPGGDRAALRARLGMAQDGPVIGHVARLAAIKNQTLLLDAFANVLRERPAAALVIVGDGDERPRLESRIAELGISGAVRLVGEVADTAPIYRDFDVFALTSNNEGTSMSLLEAMASGVAVVATSVGGSPALLNHGDCGMLVPPADVDALTRALLSLVDDVVRRERLGHAGRSHVEQAYSAAAMCRRYVEVYGFANAPTQTTGVVPCAE
jgi:glycosyltransferase involved in cell wall biosynthesis